MIRITFIGHDGSSREAVGSAGQNVMEMAVSNQIAGIDGDCGGSMACGTCHVYVEPDWLDRTGPASDFEASLLSVSLDPESNSRLACQIVLDNNLDGLVVRTPEFQKA